jgi:hypothetical protein
MKRLPYRNEMLATLVAVVGWCGWGSRAVSAQWQGQPVYMEGLPPNAACPETWHECEPDRAGWDDGKACGDWDAWTDFVKHLRRRHYFHRHSSRKHFLYPDVFPSDSATFGYHAASWRPFPFQDGWCPPAGLPAYDMSGLPAGVEPLPAPSAISPLPSPPPYFPPSAAPETTPHRQPMPPAAPPATPPDPGLDAAGWRPRGTAPAMLIQPATQTTN